KMREDNETRIKYASKYAGISNFHKKWTGESLGLKKSNAVKKRKEYEKEFSKRLAQKPELADKYGDLFELFDSLYQSNEKFQIAEIYFDEAIYRNSETFRMALLLNNLLTAYEDPAAIEEKVEEYKNRLIGHLKGIYKNYDADLDTEVSLAL